MEDIKEKLSETVIREQTIGQCDEHIWAVIEQDPNSELVSMSCVKCGSGISVAKENVKKHLTA